MAKIKDLKDAISWGHAPLIIRERIIDRLIAQSEKELAEEQTEVINEEDIIEI